jgi:hypothetical protein
MILKGETMENKVEVRGKAKPVVAADGRSAYELAVIMGYQGTLAEWLDSLKGAKGDKGDKGDKGNKPVKGVDYYTTTEKNELVAEIEREVTGDIDTALDAIIAIQDTLINGVSFRIQYPAAGIQDEFSVAYGTTWGEWAATPEGAKLVYDDGGYLFGTWTDEKVRNSNGEVQTLSSVILPDEYLII